MDPSDVARSPVLRVRLQAVRDVRARSAAASTRQMAETPQLFGQRSHIDVPHLVIPKTSSETRRFLPCAHVGPDVIASDLVFTAEDPDGFAFAVVSSSMFMAWQKAVGGRLESRLRVSNTLTWNTFPMPGLGTEMREAVADAGRGVLAARAMYPDRSLATHYAPLAMSPELLKAHRALDAAVDSVFRYRGPGDEVSRLTALFSSYATMTAEDTLPLPKAKSVRSRRP